MTPTEIQAAIEAFQLLEPELQRGVAGLIHLLHRKPKMAADYLEEARALLAKQPQE